MSIIVITYLYNVPFLPNLSYNEFREKQIKKAFCEVKKSIKICTYIQHPF